MKKPLAFETPPGIDLHVHSTASDGSLAPSELLAMATRRNLKALAITDHDTLVGSAAAIAAGIPPALHFLTGVEISAAAPDGYPIAGSVHLLGYGVDPHHSGLNGLLRRLNAARKGRNPRILERLSALGIPLDTDELARIVGQATPGRPHIAQLLVNKGLAKSVDDAFDRYLSQSRPAYVPKYRVPMDEAIAAINSAGGIAVLAHPQLNGITDPGLFERFLTTLKSMGLRGIEAIYTDHTAAATRDYCRLARRHGLLVTGGTDFHGTATPGIQMGVGDGRLHVPFKLYQRLADQLRRRS